MENRKGKKKQFKKKMKSPILYFCTEEVDSNHENEKKKKKIKN